MTLYRCLFRPISQIPMHLLKVHVSALNGALWDMEQMHDGICELG